jgi:hypothetical protein
MSSDYYGSVAGELADEGAEAGRAFLEWLNAYTRYEAEGTYHDALRDAFNAGRQSVRASDGKLPEGFARSNAYRSREAGRRDADLARRALEGMGEWCSIRGREVAEARIADPDASWSDIGRKLGLTGGQAVSLFKRLVNRAFRELGEAAPYAV